MEAGYWFNNSGHNWATFVAAPPQISTVLCLYYAPRALYNRWTDNVLFGQDVLGKPTPLTNIFYPDFVYESFAHHPTYITTQGHGFRLPKEAMRKQIDDYF